MDEKKEIAEKQPLENYLENLDLNNRASILAFGSEAQKNISMVSESMLTGVKSKDLGQVGATLGEIVQTIKNFDVTTTSSSDKSNWFIKLFRKAKPFTDIISRYSEVEQQIMAITERLEDDKAELLADVISLDKLYEASTDYLQELEHYIEAGEYKCAELQQSILPDLRSNAGEDVVAFQQVKDMENTCDDLERRLHDLRLTRQVTLQSLPGIRLIQENDKSLITKIDSTLINTVPLWKNHLAQALTIQRMKSAADNVQQANKLTNELLEANAENLRLGSAQTRKQMESGIFDIESIRKANEDLISAIHESMEIAEQGKQARQRAASKLKKIEFRLYKELVTTTSSDNPQQ